MPDVSFSHKIYTKSQADWHGISTDLFDVVWPHIFHLPDSVSPLNDCTVNRTDRRIPSHNLKLCLKNKAWFNDDCRKSSFR